MARSAITRRRTAKPAGAAALREHVLDTIDQLAVLAAEQGDVALAKTLWACWGQINPGGAEAAAAREVVWIDSPLPPAE